MSMEDVVVVEKKIEALRREMRATLDRGKLARLHAQIKEETAKLPGHEKDEGKPSFTTKKNVLLDL